MPINDNKPENIVNNFSISQIDPELLLKGIKNFTENLKADLKEAGLLYEEPTEAPEEESETVGTDHTDQSTDPAKELERLLKLAERAAENSDWRLSQEYLSIADRYQMLVGWTR